MRRLVAEGIPARPSRAIAAISVAALCGCPAQPVLDPPCPYDPVVGNCFHEGYRFAFDDGRVAAIDLPSLPGPSSACRDPARATVTRVSDGDTIEVRVDGATETERVRMIGVDTPETFVEMGYPHCYGADAKLFTQSLLGRRVALSFDRDCDDDFGRTLAYVWLGGRENDLWQRQLLRRGYARRFTVPPNDFFEDTFLGDEAIARAELRGQWRECRIAP